jgi:hypothetical protein
MEENINSCFSYERNKKTGQRPFDSNSILMQKKKKKKLAKEMPPPLLLLQKNMILITILNPFQLFKKKI